MACLSHEEYLQRRQALAEKISIYRKTESDSLQYKAGLHKGLHEELELFDTMKEMSYEEKLDYTQKLIAKSINDFKDKLALACSFGKDSTLILHFALQVDPRIKVLFNNTGIEYKETYSFRDFLVKEWNLNYHETKPIKTFWQCVKEYGYPKESRYKGHATPRCCYWLKERPAALWYKEHEIDAYLLGITWDESYQRRFTIIKYGDVFTTKKHAIKPMTKIYPIAFWDTEDVWRYIKENNIPYNKIYDRGVKRCGCAPCTGHLNWEKEMAKTSPSMFKKVFHDQGGTQLSDFDGEAKP